MNELSRIEIGRGANSNATWRVSVVGEDPLAAYDLAIELHTRLEQKFDIPAMDYDEEGPEL